MALLSTRRLEPCTRREDLEDCFRARKQPLRQEPEWQLDDFDVAVAWKRRDPLVLDRFTLEDVLALACKTIASLGRWPRQSIEGATTPSSRLEVLLARFLDAAVAKPPILYPRTDLSQVVRSRSQLMALRRTHTHANSAAKPVDDVPVHSFLKEMVQSLGLLPQPVSASAVFRHTPAKNVCCVDLQKKRSCVRWDTMDSSIHWSWDGKASSLGIASSCSARSSKHTTRSV